MPESKRRGILSPTPALARILPFAAFMLFIAGDEALAYLHRHAVINLSETLRLWLYLPRAALTATLLYLFRSHYTEVLPRDLRQLRNTLLSTATGGIVFVLWINLDWSLSTVAAPAGFDPNIIHGGAERWLWIAFRCIGAIIVVPVMEELFWRSFLLRYLIDSNFTQVAIGRLTWFSLMATTILFGLEHHYVLAGMMAGLLFSLVYRVTGSIAQCIVCHAVANLCLSFYVLTTAQWRFW